MNTVVKYNLYYIIAVTGSLETITAVYESRLSTAVEHTVILDVKL